MQNRSQDGDDAEDDDVVKGRDGDDHRDDEGR